MQSLKIHAGIAVPLPASNIDTDQILPSEFLKRITRTGFEDALFAEWRREPDFILNQPDYAQATILLAGPDFGTGSSREHAVWALQDWGFRVVISSRFADIFRSNAGKVGLLAAVVEPGDLARLITAVQAAPGATLTVDLDARSIVGSGVPPIAFSIDDYTRWRLLEGLDDIAITLQSAADIEAFEDRRPTFTPALQER